MSVNQTLVDIEIGRIASEGTGVRGVEYTAFLNAGGQWLTPVKVDFFTVSRDYQQGRVDIVGIGLMFPAGDYTFDIVPNRDNLFIDLLQTPIDERTGQRKESYVVRYKAVLANRDQPDIESGLPFAANKKDLNIGGFTTAVFQLKDDPSFQAQMVMSGRIFRRVSPMDALRSMLTETTELVNSPNGQRIQGVTVREGYNTTVRNHILIPPTQRISLFDVPEHLQNNEGGLYGAGIGCYLQNGQWYVFPPYNTENTFKSTRILNIVMVPINQYGAGERTYYVDGNNISIITASQSVVADIGLYSQLNDGNAVRTIEASRLLNMGNQQDDKYVINRRDNLHEFEGMRLADDMANAKWGQNPSTSNLYTEYTRLAYKNGQFITTLWNYGDIDLLTPGMSVKLITMTTEGEAVFEGTLVGVESESIPKTAGSVSQLLSPVLKLVLFVKRFR